MLLPEMLAVASAICVALGSMFLAELRGREPLLRLLLWQLAAGFAMTGSISLFYGGWRTVGQSELALLFGSGLVSMAIGSTTYLAAIFSVGPRLTALMFSLTAPFSVILGYLVLGETITLYQGLGVALVMGGIAFAVGFPEKSKLPVPVGPMVAATSGTAIKSRRPAGLWLGVFLGGLTASTQAIGNLLARPAMEAGVEPFTAMAIRTAVGAGAIALVALTPIGRKARGTPPPASIVLTMIATCLGVVVGMSMMMAALHLGDVGIISTLSSLTPVVILPMEWIRSGRRPPSAAWFGALLAIAGVAMISVR